MKTNAGIDFFKSITENNRNIKIDEEDCTYWFNYTTEISSAQSLPSCSRASNSSATEDTNLSDAHLCMFLLLQGLSNNI